MNSRIKPANLAAKLKKWLLSAKELQTENRIFALPITRLTSIKSFCQEKKDAEKFALYITQRTLQQMKEVDCPQEHSSSDWETYKTLIGEGVSLMERYLDNPDSQHKQLLIELLRQIDQLQGDDYRRVHWTTVHFVRSGELLKLDYALRCFVNEDFSFWAYKLAREYVERYNPSYGTGLIPESIPMLLEVAEFWCQHYFSQSLREKFPKIYP